MLRWPGRKPGLEVVSVSVPPRENRSMELKGGRLTPVEQLYWVTITHQAPSRLRWNADSSGCAFRRGVTTSEEVRNEKAARAAMIRLLMRANMGRSPLEKLG